MKITEFLRLVAQPGRTNYFVIAPDDLGLNLLLDKALAPIASSSDIIFNQAELITKEKARQIEEESRRASLTGVELTHFFIGGLQKLPADSVGPLLKAVEEAKFARFIFQAQTVPRKILTLRSRCSVVSLPFMSRKMVLANIKAENLDAKTVDQLNLYDGTHVGTKRALEMKDRAAELRREITKGARGLTALYNPELLGSAAFNYVMADKLTEKERWYLRRMDTPTRRKLVTFLLLQRQNNV